MKRTNLVPEMVFKLICPQQQRLPQKSEPMATHKDPSIQGHLCDEKKGNITFHMVI